MGRLETIAIALLRRIDRVLQRLVPVHDRRVCYQSIPDYTDNAYYTYRHALRTRSGLEHVWLVRDRTVAARIRREFAEAVADRPGHGHRLRIVAKQSIPGYLAYLSSRNVFHTHGVYAFSDAARARNVVALWHGMPIKSIARLNRASANTRPAFATASIATSQLYRYIMASAFGIEAADVEVCGQPRCDTFRSADARRTDAAEIRRVLAIPEDARLVLWMPTWRAEGRAFTDDLPPWGLTELSRAADANGCVIVTKLHPYDALNRSPDPLAGATGIRVIRSQEWLEGGIQLYDLLAASDALISDVSSVLIDYLATDRPIGMFGFDEERYDREPVLPFALFFGSSRFHRLLDPDAVHGFLGDVRDGRTVPRAPDDIAAALYDDLPELSSEAVLARVGL